MEHTPKLRLATTYYKAFRPWMGTPIQASNGRPKYELPYQLRFAVPKIYPRWALVSDRSISDAEFGRRYRADLDRVGLEEIRGVLEQTAHQTGDKTLVLMCFEANPAHCHRRDFARWWTENTGEEVPELKGEQPPREHVMTLTQQAFDLDGLHVDPETGEVR